MGVTFGRQAIKGGRVQVDNSTSINIGVPLTQFVDTFVGISGGNYGIAFCDYDIYDMFCNKFNGYDTGPSTLL